MIKDARAVGDDRVLVHGEIRAEGRASGVALEGDAYHCFWVRHGRFVRAEDHLTLKHRWMKRGEKAKSGIYREFYEALKRAEADAEVHAVAVVRKAMTKGWRAAFQYLERRHPDRWRRRESIEHEGTQHFVVKTEDLSDPELRKDLREIGRRIAGARQARPDVSGDDS